MPALHRPLYNTKVKSWDAIVIGGGIIGLSLALELHKSGCKVLIVERGEPGREASHAAGGMLVECPSEVPPALAKLATVGARMYPEFARELKDESGHQIDFRCEGTICFENVEHLITQDCGEKLDARKLAELEPAIGNPQLSENRRILGPPIHSEAVFLRENSVDPRQLTTAAIHAAKHRGIDMVTGSPVRQVTIENNKVSRVSTDKSKYSAPAVVNCAGAWSAQISPVKIPTRPRKGQMLALVGGPKLRHVIRTPDVYIIPRSDGRTVIGATVEDVGFDKRTNPETIQRLRNAAISVVPALAEAQIHEDWAGLRPGTPDDLPILGPTEIGGYFAATGHFRDGILLAPITARIMAQIISGHSPEYDLSPFSPSRFDGQTV